MNAEKQATKILNATSRQKVPQVQIGILKFLLENEGIWIDQSAFTKELREKGIFADDMEAEAARIQVQRSIKVVEKKVKRYLPEKNLESQNIKLERAYGKGIRLIKGPDLIKFAENWYERVWNQKDITGITELASPDIVLHTRMGKEENLEDYYKYHKAFCERFRSLGMKVVDPVIKDYDKVYATIERRMVVEGSEEVIESSGPNLLRIEDGKLAEVWIDDFPEYLKESGLVHEEVMKIDIQKK